MTWRDFKPGMLACPECGYNGTLCPIVYRDRKRGRFDIGGFHGAHCECDPFQLREEDPLYRRIVGVDGCALEEGTIICDAESTHEGESHSPTIVCESCFSCFDIPSGADVAWEGKDEEAARKRARDRAIRLRGQRVMFARRHECYPHAQIEAGETGTLLAALEAGETSTKDMVVRIELDKHHEGLAEWDNCIEFYFEDDYGVEEFLRCVAVAPTPTTAGGRT